MNYWRRQVGRGALALTMMLGLTALASAETLAERSLLEVAERQHDIFAKAEKEGDHVDEAWLRGELEALMKSYDVLIQKNPDYALAYGGYGMFLGKVGMPREAVIMLLRANKLDPKLDEVKNQIAVHLAEDGKPLDALPWVTAAIDLEPKKSLYHYHLGKLLAEGRAEFVRLGEFDDAKIDQAILDGFQKAAELTPGDFPLAYRHAKAYYDLKTPRWTEALAVWEKLEDNVTNDTQRQLVRMQRANVLVKLERKEEARGILVTVTSEQLREEKQTLLDELNKAGEK